MNAVRGAEMTSVTIAPLDAVAEAEAVKYRAAFAEPRYRRVCHGLDLWRSERHLFPPRFRSAIDLGCGVGRLLSVWLDEGIDAWGVDLVPGQALDPEVLWEHGDRVYAASLWAFNSGRVFDVGVCCDVLEHIPEDKLGETLARIRACCRWAVFKIANYPSVVGDHVLHVTLRDRVWWRRVLEAELRGTVTEHALTRPDARPAYLFTWVSHAS